MSDAKSRLADQIEKLNQQFMNVSWLHSSLHVDSILGCELDQKFYFNLPTSLYSQ